MTASIQAAWVAAYTAHKTPTYPGELAAVMALAAIADNTGHIPHATNHDIAAKTGTTVKRAGTHLRSLRKQGWLGRAAKHSPHHWLAIPTNIDIDQLARTINENAPHEGEHLDPIDHAAA